MGLRLPHLFEGRITNYFLRTVKNYYYYTSRPRIFKNENVSVNTYHSIRDNNHVLKLYNENITILLSNSLLFFLFYFCCFTVYTIINIFKILLTPLHWYCTTTINLLLLPN